MIRERGYSASLDIGRYPVADEGNNIWDSLCLIFCCVRNKYKTDGYDSDSSDFNRCIDSDSDDDND